MPSTAARPNNGWALMEWFRHYHGLTSHHQVRTAAVTAGVHQCFAVAAWCFVLEHASAAEERGSVADLKPKHMAVALGMGLDEAGRLLAAMAEEGLIADGRIVGWERRQKRSDTSAERTAEWRERKRNRPKSDDVTPPSSSPGDDVTSQTPPGDVTKAARSEKRREDRRETPPVGPPRQPEPPPSASADPIERQPDRSRGTRLPEGWQPTPDLIEFARKEGLSDADIERERERFRDHWLGAAGQRGRKSDWAAAWRNWARKAADDRRRFAGRSSSPGGGGSGNGRADRPSGIVAGSIAVLRRRQQMAGFVH